MPPPKIESQDVSVVVQGPIVEGTRRALESVRRVLPRAQVILSTWEGSPVEGLPCDRLVTTADPGWSYLLTEGTGARTNIDRQIVSTQAGLRCADRPYTLKFRTDLELTHAGFLSYFGRYPARLAEWRVFSERLIVCDHFSRNPARRNLTLPRAAAPRAVRAFHPSDMAAFGLTEDVQTYWDAQLPTLTLDDLSPDERARVPPEAESKRFIRRVPEQYLWLDCLRRVCDLQVAEGAEESEPLRDLAERSLVNNFVILRRAQFGVVLPRHPLNLGQWSTLYTFRDYLELYHRVCDSGQALPFDWAHWLKDLAYRGSWSPTPAARFLRRILARFEPITRNL